MTPKFHAVATLGSYTDKATGKKVKRFLTVGTVFESPNGHLFMRLDALPVSADWSRFLAFRSITGTGKHAEDSALAEDPEDTPPP